MNKEAENYFAHLNLYSTMAHFVGKTLHIRPSTILDTWGVPELIVAYGYYIDEISQENYEQWKHMDAKDRGAPPKEYAVEFYSVEEDD